jgi:hypothetical protein
MTRSEKERERGTRGSDCLCVCVYSTHPVRGGKDHTHTSKGWA